jgi:hypothetical protein
VKENMWISSYENIMGVLGTHVIDSRDKKRERKKWILANIINDDDMILICGQSCYFFILLYFNARTYPLIFA